MPIPTEIKLHKKSKLLELSYDDTTRYQLSCEYLRVFSPSAEARGHGPESRKLIVQKRHVSIVNIEPVGSYAVKLIFDDGHATGLYTWEILHSLCVNQQRNWADYLAKIEAAGLKRE